MRLAESTDSPAGRSSSSKLTADARRNRKGAGPVRGDGRSAPRGVSHGNARGDGTSLGARPGTVGTTRRCEPTCSSTSADRPSGDTQNDDITLDDARYLVAREHGFERWDALVKFYTSVPVQPSLITTKPIGLFAAEAVGDESPAWNSRDWSAVVARLKERDATGIDAAGQMTDAMIQDVAHFEHITALKLGGSRSVTDAGLRHLARLSGLRYLDLSGTGITDRGTRGPAGAVGAGEGLLGLDECHGRRSRESVGMRCASATSISRAPHPATVPSVPSRARHVCVNCEPAMP